MAQLDHLMKGRGAVMIRGVEMTEVILSTARGPLAMSAETADVHVPRLLLTDTSLDLVAMAVTAVTVATVVTIEIGRTGVA